MEREIRDRILRGQGNIPQWTQQAAAVAAPNGAPALATDGVEIHARDAFLVAVTDAGATTWTGRLWVTLEGDDAPAGWHVVLDSDIIDNLGSVMWKAAANGARRVYLQLTAVAGDAVDIAIGAIDADRRL